MFWIVEISFINMYLTQINYFIIDSNTVTIADIIEGGVFLIRIEVLFAAPPADISYEFPIEIPIRLEDKTVEIGSNYKTCAEQTWQETGKME